MRSTASNGNNRSPVGQVALEEEIAARKLRGSLQRGSEIKLTQRQRDVHAAIQRVWRRLAIHLLSDGSLVAPWSLGVTSVTRGEGKSTNCLGLALALAQEGDGKVALLEADLEHSTLGQAIGVSAKHSLTGHLLGRYPLFAAIAPTHLPGVAVLPGRTAEDADALSAMGESTMTLRRHFPRVLAELKERFSHVIVDLPGILDDPNVELMARSLEGLLLVVRGGVTSIEKARQAVQLIEGDSLRGVIHLDTQSPLPRWLSTLLVSE